MTPLRITAQILGGVNIPQGPPAFDALLAYAVAQREGLPPPATASECAPIEIPVQRSACGRFHLATVGICTVESREIDWTNRRFPIPEAQELGVAKFTRVNIAAGAQKSYRLPRERSYLDSDRMTFFCIGDAPKVESLLDFIDYLGKRRAVGLGKVARWDVEPCEPWGDGFPCVRDGRPLRALPPDWPGLSDDTERAFACLSYPYWNAAAKTECAVPSWAL